MMAVFELKAIAQGAVVGMAECLVEGGLISIFAALLLKARRLNAGAKFVVWFWVLVAIAALPLLGGRWWSDGMGVSAQIPSGSSITLPGSWALYILGVWAVLAAWFLLGIGRGLWHLHVLRKSCVAVDARELDLRLLETLARGRSKRPITLCVSDQVQVPTAIGLVKPAVVIPNWVMQELSADELNLFVLHELAHLRRRDDWTNLVQKIVKALFFFHPAIWWIERRVSLEREIACDDAVLAETASPRAYAECLAHLAEKTLVRRSLALAQAALGRLRQTSLRVAQILDIDRPMGTTRAWGMPLALVAAFSVASVLGVARAPRLVGFSDSLPSTGVNSINATASESGERSLVPSIIPASYTQASEAGSNKRLDRHVKHRGLPLIAERRKVQTAERVSALGSVISDPDSGRVTPRAVRQTNTDAVSLPPTEALFVIVQGSQSGPAAQPVYIIRVWRVMLFHLVADPVGKASSRKT
jgi:beta-lactamase regulating signal transducer with metallopeptidase domain